MDDKNKIVRAVIITAAVTAVATGFITSFVKDNISPYLVSGDADKMFARKTQSIERILRTHYLYDYDETELRENALRSYVDALDEPYTHYYSPSEFSSYLTNTQDGYVGIGVVAGVDDNDRIVVIAPFEDTPAFEAGIEPGDIITAVEGKEYDGSMLTEAVDAIKDGKEGTSVNITILKTSGETVDLSIERRDISADSVKTEMLGDGVAYMRITGFNMSSENGEHSTSSEFERQLSSLKEQGADKLIIDLRDNPGGVLSEVCKIADALLPEGTITYTETKDGKKKYFSSDAEFTDMPLAVIVNGNSASASEVLTGALKDYGRAVTVGTKTYGKGIVQDVIPFFDGSGLSVTSAKYYTPNGVCIHDIGIEPDIICEPSEEYKDAYATTIPREDDLQLQKAIEAVKEK